MPVFRSQKEVHPAENGAFGVDLGKRNNIFGHVWKGEQPTRADHEALELFHDPHEELLPKDDDRDCLFRKVQALESCLTGVFSVISSLKQAYVQLRAAHTPYDPNKLRSSDKAVVLELKKLADLKRNFQEKLGYVRSSGRKSNAGQKTPDPDLNPKSQGLEKSEKEFNFNITKLSVENYESCIQKCRQEIQQKDAKIKEKDEQIEERDHLINELKNSLMKATEKAEKLEKKAKNMERSRTLKPSLISESALVPQLFEMAVHETKDAVSSFTLILLKFMKESKWEIDAAANSIERGINYPEAAHKNFAFESYVSHRIFDGFEIENFCMNTSFSAILNGKDHKHDCLLQFQDMRFVDPSELLTINPDCLFGNFCHRKYLQTVHQSMEEAFFGHLHQRLSISNGGHPTTNFYKSFLKLAKSVWLLHLLSFAFTPTISIFQVKRKAIFHPLYMESVIQPIDFYRFQREVGLTVFPGFFLEKQILRCQVYLEGISTSD